MDLPAAMLASVPQVQPCGVAARPKLLAEPKKKKRKSKFLPPKIIYNSIFLPSNEPVAAEAAVAVGATPFAFAAQPTAFAEPRKLPAGGEELPSAQQV